ncbi:hypothetical protein [Polaromonas sp. YR568]|uniref:hypothetical protein n=1 Tax=Polaromonas sp. YR568 TaxID=1855301 RepID=UPI003137D86A
MTSPLSSHTRSTALLPDAVRLTGGSAFTSTAPPPAAPPRNVVASGAYPPAAHVHG